MNSGCLNLLMSSKTENKRVLSTKMVEPVNAVVGLEQNHCACKLETVPMVCSPLSVVVSSTGKKQLVIDLRYLNGYLLKKIVLSMRTL